MRLHFVVVKYTGALEMSGLRIGFNNSVEKEGIVAMWL